MRRFLLIAVLLTICGFSSLTPCGAEQARASTREVAAQVNELEAEVGELRKEVELLRNIQQETAVVIVDSETGGKGFGRIVGGQVVPRGQLEHCAAVGDGFDYFCTGTLISPRLVVTAAHCLPGVRKVFLRGSSLFSPTEGEEIEVDREEKHPTADIAILVLRRDSTVAPARLGQDCHLSRSNIATVAGFGTTNFAGTIGYGVKRFVPDLPIADASCTLPLEFGCIPGIEMVAGLRGLDKDTCRGDSGGPLYVVNNGEPLLVGVTSRGASGGTRVCGDGGIYVRVDKFTDWIRERTNIEVTPAGCP